MPECAAGCPGHYDKRTYRYFVPENGGNDECLCPWAKTKSRWNFGICRVGHNPNCPKHDGPPVKEAEPP